MAERRNGNSWPGIPEVWLPSPWAGSNCSSQTAAGQWGRIDGVGWGLISEFHIWLLCCNACQDHAMVQLLNLSLERGMMQKGSYVTMTWERRALQRRSQVGDHNVSPFRLWWVGDINEWKILGKARQSIHRTVGYKQLVRSVTSSFVGVRGKWWCYCNCGWKVHEEIRRIWFVEASLFLILWTGFRSSGFCTLSLSCFDSTTAIRVPAFPMWIIK